MSTSIITYTPPESNLELNLKADYETGSIWSTQRQLSDALGLDVRTISEHITNFKNQHGDTAKRHIRKFRITAEDGKMYNVEHYDMTVAAYTGFRAQATMRILQFQEWVGEVLNQHLRPKRISNIDALEIIVAELRATDTRLKAVESQNADLYQKQGDIAQSIEAITDRLDDADYLTVRQFCQKQRIKFTASIIIMWGKKAAELSRARNVWIGETIEGQYNVGRYHKDILIEVCVAKPKNTPDQLTLLD